MHGAMYFLSTLILAAATCCVALMPQSQIIGTEYGAHAWFWYNSSIGSSDAYVTIYLQEIMPFNQQGLVDISRILQNKTSYYQRPTDLNGVHDALFPTLIFTNSTSTNGSKLFVQHINLCSKLTSSDCIYSGVSYSYFMVITNPWTNQTETSDTNTIWISSLGSNFRPKSISSTTTSSTIYVVWQPQNASTANILVGYDVMIKFSVEGNAWDFGAIQAANGTALTKMVMISNSLSATATSFTLNGCYQRLEGSGTFCIAPWTVYQVVLRSKGTISDMLASVYAVTKEGLPRYVPTSTVNVNAVSNIITLRFVNPRPLTAPIVGYQLNYTSSSGNASFYTPLLNVTGSAAESLYIDGLGNPLTLVRVLKATPFVNYTISFAPLTSVGIASEYTGPIYATTAPTVANQPPPPFLEVRSLNSTSQTVFKWCKPTPPYGVIVRYQVIVAYDANNLTSGTIIYDSNDTSVLSIPLPQESIPADMNIRVRAWTNVGAGPWSDKPSDRRPMLAAPSANQDDSTKSIDRTWIVAAIVVPIIFALLIAILVLLRRPRPSGAVVFEFPTSDQWEIKSTSLEIQEPIGSGAFGHVHAGLLYGQRVAVKTMRNSTTLEEKRAFIGEAQALKRVNTPGHSNVLRLIGCVLTHNPLLVVTELVENKDLKTFLIKNRDENHNGRSNNVKLTRQLLFRFCSDISKGMEYLANLGWVHRDLACRNCLVSKDITIKISDFGLSKDIGDVNYYRESAKDATLPIRWMAPECLLDGKFDSKGDIWSFGIVMWEIFSLGQTPYATMSNTEVLERVVMGYRLASSPGTPEAAYTLMLQCWSVNRPSFESMTKALLFWAEGGDLHHMPEIEIYREKREASSSSNYIVLRSDNKAQLAAVLTDTENPLHTKIQMSPLYEPQKPSSSVNANNNSVSLMDSSRLTESSRPSSSESPSVDAASTESPQSLWTDLPLQERQDDASPMSLPRTYVIQRSPSTWSKHSEV